jgi:membrane fusion protein, multidrug efflux system
MSSITQTVDTPAASAAGRPAHSPAKSAAKPARAVTAWWKPAAGALVGVALLAWLGHTALHAFRYEETDDAYVTGHLHQISPQLDGQVKEVLVSDNQTVRAGDVLVRLDPLQSELVLQKAKASLEQAHANAVETRAAAGQAAAQTAEAQARVQQAAAQLAQTEAQLQLAQLTSTRTDQLFAKGGVNSQADVDTAHSALEAAKAAHAANQANATAAQSAVVSAEAAQNSAKAQIAAADASVAVAEAAVRDAERQLGYTTITAPAPGRIGNKAVEVGNRVLAGQTLFSLAAPETWIIANFKETQLARMQPGQVVELSVDALPGHTLLGKVDSISPASGAQFALLPPDNATGNFNKVVQRVPVKILLTDEARAELGDRLRLGLSVIVNVRVR